MANQNVQRLAWIQEQFTTPRFLAALSAALIVLAAQGATAIPIGAQPAAAVAPVARAQRADSTYKDHIAAAGASTPAVAHEHLVRALALLHGHPDAYYLLAQNAVRLGLPEAAVSHLRTIAAMGLWYDAEHDTVLAPLKDRADYQAVVAAMAANRLPLGHSTTVVTLSDPNLLTEDVAFDPATKTFYVSAIHRRQILAVSHGTFATTTTAPMALVVDPKRHALWATVAAMPQAEGIPLADSGHTGVIRYDLRTKQRSGRYDLPFDGTNKVLGDMTLDAAGNAIVSNGAGGGVYIVANDTLSTLVPPGTFESPQTPAVAPDGRIFVADYALGVGIINPTTHAVTWLAHADTVALSGIDGMYLSGHSLYAIQNGTSPERVTRFLLDPDLHRVVDWSVIERATPGLGDPTHGVVVGDDFYYIVNSGWDRFGNDGRITKTAGSPARLVRVSLKQ